MTRIITLVALFSLFAACERTVKKQPAVKEQTAFTEPVQSLPPDIWRGVCFAHSWERMGLLGYGSEASMEALTHLQKQGVDYVSITPFGFMGSLDSTEVRGTHNGTFNFGETDQRVTDVTMQARQLGIKVMLKPHIWIKHGEWRGRIEPKDENGKVVWDTWWQSHNRWIMHYAELAQKLEIESLVIGLELHTAVQNRPEKLIELANAVREVYDGHITYSANWNEPVPLKVWKSLDSVGVQLYPPLVKKGEPHDDDVIRANLNKQLDHWSDMANRAQIPVVVTEYGFRSAEGAARYPNAWPDRNPNEVPNDELQAHLYKIFFEEISKREEIAGVFLWKYFTNKNTDEEGPNGFSPRGKVAEHVIRAFHAKETKLD